MDKKEKFRQKRRTAVRTNRQKKREAFHKDLDKIDRDRREGRIRESYIGIKKVKKGYQARSNIIKHTDGTIKVQEDDVNRVWKEHF